MAAYFAYYIIKSDSGNDKMKEIALAIRQGANAFLKRQYLTIALIALIVAILILEYTFLPENRAWLEDRSGLHLRRGVFRYFRFCGNVYFCQSEPAHGIRFHPFSQ